MKIRLVIVILVFLGSFNLKLSAVVDTLYLTVDSSLVITYEEFNGTYYDVTVFDRVKNVLLYRISDVAATTRIVKKSTDTYHVAAETYLPEFGKENWKPFEFVRYVIKIRGNEYSFFKTYQFVNYPRLTKSQMDNIINNAENILTNDYVRKKFNSNHEEREKSVESESYLRNVGFLALGILNGNSICLDLFNNVSDECTGGEGCEAYIELQTALSYTEYCSLTSTLA
jgi:hypothetical protein